MRVCHIPPLARAGPHRSSGPSAGRRVGRAADERGDGVVVTSINGRQETRVYAKPVTQGVSAHNLSLEEEEAIRRALDGQTAAVEAG